MRNKFGRYRKGFHPATEFKKGHKMSKKIRDKISNTLKKLPRKNFHIIQKCLNCKKEFRVLIWYIKKGGGKYCSWKCYAVSEKGKHWFPQGEFKKGYKSKNPFKKGHIPWCKGIKRPDISGEKNPHWKGGKHYNDQGYILIYKPNHPFAIDKYIREHRLVIERYLGRYLTNKEVVHHINGIRDDNRIENLKLMIDSKHKSMETYKRWHKS